ncbi:MAG TPA: hypothetical protein VGO62_16270 [Myxococcota bacterium]
MKPFRDWTVLPHGNLERVDENILSVTGDLRMPLGDTTRRMTVVRLASGDLVIYSAISLDDSEMLALEEMGRPAYLIVPSTRHRMDAKIWKDRYPSIIVVAPPAARNKVAEIVQVDKTAVDFNDPNVKFQIVPGTDEAALIVQCNGGITLIVSDLVFNIANQPGMQGFLSKLMGMTGDKPHLPKLVEMRAVKDRAALSAQLEEWAHLDNLKRIIVAHGSIVNDDPAMVLHAVAHELAL